MSMSVRISGIVDWLRDWFFTKSDYDSGYDFVVDTGWNDVSYSDVTGYRKFSDYSENTHLRVRRIGKIVHLDGAVTTNDFDVAAVDDNTTIGYMNLSRAITSNGETNYLTIAQLDEKYRPSSNIMLFQQSSMSLHYRLLIQTDGKIRIGYHGDDANVDLPLPPWLNVMCTWTVGGEQ